MTTKAIAVQALQQLIDEQVRELDLSMWAMSLLAPGADIPEPPKKAPTPAKSSKAPKAAKTKKSAKPSRATAAVDDAPRTARGKLPSVGVLQELCSSLKERQRRVGILKENGYTRVGPGEPLVAGTFDVRSTGDGDDSCVVLWRSRLDEAAA